MRRRLALLVSAAMALTLLAFAIPLAILIKTIASEKAVADATDDVRALSALVAADPSVPAVRAAIPLAGRPVTVFLPGQRPVGVPAARTDAVLLAARGNSFMLRDRHGLRILVAVQGLPGGTAVITTLVPDSALRSGVTRSWVILAALGLVLLGLGMLIASLLVGTVTRPLRELADVSRRLAAGRLEARAAPAGPPEVRDLAGSVNHLATRIRELIVQERESVADLSHRLRTPLTALRLELEAVAGTADPDGRLGDKVEAVEQAVTALIQDARNRTGSEPASCDVVRVARQRAEFWSVLAGDQARVMMADIPAGPLLAGITEAECGACLDALLGNVFVHTSQGTGFVITLAGRRGGGAVLTVHDEGPGFGHGGLVRRGASGGGSTGLGLDIARQAAEASGGRMSIGPGPGGTVIVEFGPPAPVG
ncbi:MAG TPA: HAMP domain-containing sensor histidine kinase [Streptosporangiaceae bacterium]